ncbi:MAG: hypothetical protein ACKVOP_06295 [Sphingomonadaceae bacterium]
MISRALAAAMLMSAATIGVTHAQTPPPPPSPTPAPTGHTALYFQFGQSNAVGVAPLTQLPQSADFSTGPRPIQEVHVFSGSGTASLYRLRNLNYVRTAAERVTDSIDGSITGPRGETVVLANAKAFDIALSSLVGVAETVRDGYNTAASKVVFFKVAQGGTFLTAQDPYATPIEGGGVYRNGRRAIVKWMRGYVDAEVKAGRGVAMQIAKLDQGGAEAVEAERNGEIVSARMLGWSSLLRERIYPYYVEKFGVAFPLLIPQMLLIRTENDPGAPLEPQTEAQNAIEEGACRYTVNIDANGAIIDVIDNGASPTRLDHAYFLKHGRTERSLTEVHTSYPLARVFGIARTNVQRHIEAGDQGLTRYAITRIAPVIMQYSSGNVTSSRIAVDIAIDETSKVTFLALPTGATPPTVTTVKLTGRTYTVKVDANGNPYSQRFNVYPLQPNTAYDVYAVATDPKFGHTGSVYKVGTNVRTLPRL